MFLFYISITLAIVSSALYHFSAKSTPSNVNFPISLVVTYAVALGITLLTAFLFPPGSAQVELRQLNWASPGRGPIVGIELDSARLSLGLEPWDRRRVVNVGLR
jgi:hypothetical protein